MVLARAPPPARGGADGALVRLLRLGQPCVSGRSRRARLWCAVRAGRPCTLGAPLATWGEVMAHLGPPALRAEARHASHGGEEGGERERAAARGGEVKARLGGATLRVPAAGSPRGCAHHRGSRP